MRKYDIRLLEKSRMGNNANNYEWQVVTEWLSTGKIENKNDMQICYENMQKNKQWYYEMNYKSYESESEDLTIIVCFVDVVLFFVTIFGYIPFMNNIVAEIIHFKSYYYTLTETLPDIFDFVIWALSTVGIMAGNFKFFKKILVDKNIDDLQKSLEFGLGIKHSKSKIFGKLKEKILAKVASRSKQKEVGSLKDYVDKELAERGTNQDDEIIKKQNEEHASAFVRMIGDDIKSIYANPYPNCQKEIEALQQLSDDYVEYMIKEKEAKETGKINLRLPGSNNFYTKLNDLETKIKDNMKINKLRQYNKGYIADIVKDASKAVEQDNQFIYNGPVINGHVPTVEEQFYAESQNYNATDTEDKGRGRVLSPNNK